MFIGMQFFGDDWCYSTITPEQNGITKLQIMNGIYDNFFGSIDINMPHSFNSLKWDFYTRFYAKFQNSLMAGNVEYSAETVSTVRIKRRKANEHSWFTVFEIPIQSNTDFDFEKFDRFAQGKQDYYYSLIPVSNNIEGNINLNNIYSDFDSYYLSDRDISYHIFINTKLNTTINKDASSVITLGRKYPFYISNGKSNYRTGTLSFTLLPTKECEFDLDAAYEYRTKFENWLTNGSPKILKDWTGQIFMINITETISIDFSDVMLPVYNVNFVEIGDVLNDQDMYLNGFTDGIYMLNGNG